MFKIGHNRVQLHLISTFCCSVQMYLSEKSIEAQKTLGNTLLNQRRKKAPQKHLETEVTSHISDWIFNYTATVFSMVPETQDRV